MPEIVNNNVKWKTFKLIIWIAAIVIGAAFTYIGVVADDAKENRDDIVDLKVLTATIDTKLDGIKESVDEIKNFKR